MVSSDGRGRPAQTLLGRAMAAAARAQHARTHHAMAPPLARMRSRLSPRPPRRLPGRWCAGDERRTGRRARVRERGMESVWRHLQEVWGATCRQCGAPPAGSVGRHLQDAGVGAARRAAAARRVQAGEREEAGREERHARGAVRRAQQAQPRRQLRPRQVAVRHGLPAEVVHLRGESRVRARSITHLRARARRASALPAARGGARRRRAGRAGPSRNGPRRAARTGAPPRHSCHSAGGGRQSAPRK